MLATEGGFMHELGRYLQRNLEDRGWTVSELIRRSGLSRQTVYNLLNDSREHMDQTPQRKTVNGLAKALGVSQAEVLTISALAIGVPLETPTPGQTLDAATDEQILKELASRLSRSKDQDNASRSHNSTSSKRRLRAVDPQPGDTSSEQKTEPNDLGVTEIFGEEARNYPVPPIEQMAAHPYFKTKQEKWDEVYGERGEESQDPGNDT